MRNDAVNDSGPPYDPRTPEEFAARGEEEFQSWWDELNPAGCYDGVCLDHHTARVVWRAAYEHQSIVVALIYDSAEVHGGSSKTTAEIELGYVVARYHNGSISFAVNDLVAWMAEHEKRIRRDLDESEDESIQIRIISSDDASQEAALEHGMARAGQGQSNNPARDRRSVAEEQFQRWWDGLDPSAWYDGTHLDAELSRIVWHVAFAHLWDSLELVHDSAKAHAAVADETAQLELGYIVDRYHHGFISIGLDDMTSWMAEHESWIQRERDENKVSIHVRACD